MKITSHYLCNVVHLSIKVKINYSTNRNWKLFFSLKLPLWKIFLWLSALARPAAVQAVACCRSCLLQRKMFLYLKNILIGLRWGMLCFNLLCSIYKEQVVDKQDFCWLSLICVLPSQIFLVYNIVLKNHWASISFTFRWC